MPKMVNGPSPVLLSVTVCCADEAPTFWLKLSRLGPRRARAIVEIPKTGMRCGLSTESSATTTYPSRSPRLVGMKVTPMAQLAPGASTIGQLLVCEKSPSSWMALR